jgi:hypothetical protein
MPVSGPLPNPSLITSEKTNSMQNTLKYFFVLLLILFQPSMETAYAAKPIFPSSIQKSKRDKKENPPKTNTLAKWSLILSAIGFLSIFIPYVNFISIYLIVGGIVCGIIALGQIKKRKEKGSGLAITSLVVGGVTVIGAIVAIAVLLSIFN